MVYLGVKVHFNNYNTSKHKQQQLQILIAKFPNDTDLRKIQILNSTNNIFHHFVHIFRNK